MRSAMRRADLPGLTMVRLRLDGPLSRAIPLTYASLYRVAGESEWSVGREQWTVGPGTIGLKVPGEVYVERVRRGPSDFQVLVFDDALVEEARAALELPHRAVRTSSFDRRRDPRVRPLAALHEATLAWTAPGERQAEGAPPARVSGGEVMLTEAVTALVQLTGATRIEHRAPRAVSRARALLDARITEAVSLDELAAHAGLDKFRLCRAFREEIGLPPHAYVTHRRISLAQGLLARGVPQAEVAARVGLYDQSQLHRHFKRIAGVTPGAFARALRPVDPCGPG